MRSSIRKTARNFASRYLFKINAIKSDVRIMIEKNDMSLNVNSVISKKKPTRESISFAPLPALAARPPKPAAPPKIGGKNALNNLKHVIENNEARNEIRKIFIRSSTPAVRPEPVEGSHRTARSKTRSTRYACSGRSG